MALVVKDRVKETTTSTGTGTITLAGATQGYQSFSVVGDGNTTYYTITDGTNWEVGIGTYTASGTTLSRDTILESSNSGSAVNFSAGVKDVFVTYPAEKAVTLDGTETLTNKTINASNNTVTNVSLTTGVTGTLPVANGGTGATTASGARTSLDVPSSTGSGASGTWGIDITGNSATVSSITSGQVTTALGYTPVNIAGDTFTGTVNFPSSSFIASNLVGFYPTSYMEVGSAFSQYGGTFEVSGNATFYGDLKSSVFYSRNNTAYYLEPASTGTSLTVAGSVGIGTTSPAEKIHIDGGVAAGYLKATNNASTQGIEVGISNAGDGVINVQDAAALRLFTSDAERLRITSAGDVGIGTTNPSFYSGKLTVAGGNIAIEGGNRALFWNTGGTGVASIQGVGTNELSFSTSNSYTERLRITSAGLVGIGTSSPAAVSGTTALEITGASGGAGAEVVIGSTDTTATTGDLFGGLAFKSIDVNGTPPHYSGIKARAADTFGGADLEFYVGRSNYESNDPRFVIEGPQSVSGEAMRIDSSGNVGIGTTNPALQFVVSNGGAGGLEFANSGLIQSFNRSTGVYQNLQIDAALIAFRPNGTEAMRITSAGSVGIGTSSPSALLDVAGDAEINGLTVGRGAGNVSGNTASGYQALESNTTGGINTASGYQALYSNTTGSNNTASGYRALYSNTTGNSNTASGRESLRSNTTGSNNTASGRQALYSNTIGGNNTASGRQALNSNTTGNNNTASGYQALLSNTTGSSNTASGYYALRENTTGDLNTAYGREAGYDNTEGTRNTYIGYNTGRGITTGNYNTIVGAGVTGLSASLSNNVIIADGQGNRRINIDSSGSVGIGTTSPSQTLQVQGTGYATSDFRAPLFYDSNDTAYYANPKGTSNFNGMISTGRIDMQSTDGYQLESGKHRITHNDGGGNFNIRVGHKYDSGYVSTETGYAGWIEYTQNNGLWQFWTSDASVTSGGAVSFNEAIRISPTAVTLYYDGASKLATTSTGISVTGTGTATSDFRAPIFYDSDNTARYVDPSGTSVFNKLTTSRGAADQLKLERTNSDNNVNIEFVGTSTTRYLGKVGGDLKWGANADLNNTGDTIFHDGYHPNADTLTTARTISLTGDVSGSTSFNGSANVSITATVADDSHNHIISNVDGLQTALDGKLSTTGKAADSNLLDGIDSTQFLRSDTADTATGRLTFDGGIEVRSGTGGGKFRIKRNTGSTDGDDITDIHMNDSSLFFDIDNDNDGDTGYFYFRRKSGGSWVAPNAMYAGSDQIFTDGYHPNADTLTTARTISLTGDVSGSTSFDGSANVSITATVADDSHNHIISNVDGLQTALDAKAPISAPDFTGEVYTSASQDAWAFRATTGASSNSSGLWFSGLVSMLLLRDSSGTIKTRLAANGSTNDNQINGNPIHHDGYAPFANLTSKTSGTGTYQTSGDFRAPIFYDSDNTGYYINPNGNSKFGGNITGDAITGIGKQAYTNLAFMPTVGGGSFRANNNATGAIQITMPTTGGADMISFWVDVFDYTGNESFSVYVAGYVYQAIGNNVWVNETALIIGADSSRNFNVRFGHDGSDACVWIGETNSVWSYPQVTVRDVQAGHSANVADWIDGWSISLATSFTAVERTISNAFPASRFDTLINTSSGTGTYQTSGSFRAPIFYDSGNTAYYVDPNSTSVLNHVQIDGNLLQNSTNRAGLLQVNYPAGATWMGYSIAFSGTSHWSLMGHQTAVGVYDDYNNEWAWRYSENGTIQLYFDGTTQAQTASGYFLANNQMRAPIYYDSDNTAYYVDPASTSNLNVLTLAGDLTVNGGDLYTPQYFNVRYSSATAGGLRLYDSEGTLNGSWYGSGTGEHGFLDNDLHWAVRVRTGTNPLTLHCNNNPEFYVYSSYVLAPGSMRSPIFYDSNDTGYYVNPAGESVLNTVTFFGELNLSATGQTYVDHTGTIIFRNQSGYATSATLTTSGNFTATGNVTAYSDIRVKDNVKQIEGALDKVQAIRGVTYNRTDLEDTERRYGGVIAQEIEKILPEAIFENDDRKAVDYNATIGLLIEAIKELKAEVETLKKG